MMAKLDRMDRKILDALQLNARISNKDLADKVALSPSACHTRMKRLERLGFVDQYICRLNLNQIRKNVTVFAEVTLKYHNCEDIERFMTMMSMRPEIVEAYEMSGAPDFYLKIICEDIDSYREFSSELLGSEIKIAHMKSNVVLGVAKPYSGVNIISEEQERDDSAAYAVAAE